MPRQKKQHLKKRSDGRYACRYKDQWFYGWTEAESIAQRDAYKAMVSRGVSENPNVRDFGEKWIIRANPTVTASTMTGLKIHLKKLTDIIGDLQLPQVKPSHIKAIFSAQYVGLSDSYIRSGRQLFASMFDAAVADGYIRTNPVREKAAKPHKGTVGGHRQITQQERTWIETLCQDHRAHAAVMTMLYAGIRPQEMKAVLIDRDVDLNAETITLHEFAHLDGLEYKLTAKGKTDHAARTIPLLPPLKAALDGKKGYLITNAAGQRVNIQAWRSVWASYVFAMETAINGIEKRWYGRTKAHKAILAAGGDLPPWIPFTVVPYDLRHSFCCMCRDNGVELKTCIRWMGHADAKMILKIYDEASDNRAEIEAEKLKKTFNCSQNGSQTQKEKPPEP